MRANLDFNIGLKLHSTDVSIIPKAQDLMVKGGFDYIELYAIPGSYKNTIQFWKAFDIPYIIHAPHSFHGINLAQAERWRTNFDNFADSKLFADSLGADIIIVHGGNNGSISETIRQISLLGDSRIILENKPKIGLQNEECVGWSANDFKLVADAGVLHGTVLDFGHAVYAARSIKVNVMEIVKELIVFNPKLFHLTDGDTSSERDVHLNLGKGNFDIREFLSVIPSRGMVTIETPRHSENLEDFVNDVRFLQRLLSE
ncbi:MAG: sugar phosphate isomerase/epimerase [Planctomycetes bacterium]|nr:sugar phosphate isomerase/epimerase [Planctomycetota bacterium]